MFFQINRSVLRKRDAFFFQQGALFVSAANFVRRKSAVTIDDALPWNGTTARVQNAPHLSRAARRTGEPRDLSIRQNLAARNGAHDFENAVLEGI